jgi:hypothetical protein
MLSVFPDGIILLVYTDSITDGLFRILKKKHVDDMEVFAGDFTNEITEGIQTGSPYSDVTLSPTESPRESPMKIFSLVIPSVNVNISPRCRPSSPLPYFSFFFPYPCI